MKYLISTLTIIIFFNGCSKNNAFDDFKLDKEQELSINSIQSSKIQNKDSINGVFSAIYLNEVYPDSFFGNEYFFVYFYMKEKADLYNPNIQNNYKAFLKLNGVHPIEVKKLASNNQFSKLIGINNEWNSYYLVSFKKQDAKDINLYLENDPFVSDFLRYQKAE